MIKVRNNRGMVETRKIFPIIILCVVQAAHPCNAKSNNARRISGNSPMCSFCFCSDDILPYLDERAY